MNPLTHLLIGWTLAAPLGRSRRERAVITAAAIIPDLDAFGIGPEKLTLTLGWERPLLWWTEYHHVLGHNLAFALVVSVAGGRLTRSSRVGLLAFVSFHLHLLGDLIGARGPDGFLWPIPYLWPLSREPELVWEHAWALNAWPNMALTAVLLAFALRFAWLTGDSPLGLVWARGDRLLVEALRGRFGEPP